MITLDFKSEAPIQKSHDWLDVDTMGIWRVYKIIKNVGKFAVADFNGTHIAWHDGSYSYIYELSSGNTTQLDTTQVRGDILLTDDAVYRLNGGVKKFDLNGNLIWNTDLQSPSGASVHGSYNRLAIFDGYLYATASYSNDKYLFRIKMDTGEVLAWNKGTSYGGEPNNAYPLGDWIVMRQWKTPYGIVFDRDTLTFISSNPRDFPNAIPYKFMARILGYIGNKMYYTNNAPNYLNDDIELYGGVHRAVVDETNKTVYDEIQVPILQPNNNQDTYWYGTAYDDILAMRGFNISTDGRYSLIYNPWRYSHWGNSDFGYVPITEEVSMTYAINTTKKVLYMAFDNKSPVVNIHNQGVEDFYYYYVYISKDLSNWTQIENMQDLSGLDLTGTIYLKIVWNPESFTMPVLKPFYLITAGNIKTVKAFTRQYRRAII